MKITNYIIIFAILALTIFIIVRYLKNTEIKDEDSTGEIKIEKPTIRLLVQIVSKNLNAFLKQDFTNQNLNKSEFDRKNMQKARLRKSAKESASGNHEAKRIIMEYIRTIISTNKDLAVSEENIDEFIPFDNPEQMKPQDKFLFLLQKYLDIFKHEGLSVMFKDFGWDKSNNITEEMVNEAYDKALDINECEELSIKGAMIEITFNDKMNYIIQKIFEQYKGFGVADILFETDVDEIDGGVSGIPYGSFELNNDIIKSFSYSYEAIWILYHGHNIRLSCLSFGAQEELVRVCNNVYKYNAQKVFSRSAGYVVSSMKDGSRVVVTRPPFSDKYAFYVRKFDSAPSIKPEKLITGEGWQIPFLLCKWFIKGQRNVAVTGQQGTGKTTLLKSFIEWIDNLNIRTQELAFEMHLAFSYPEKNIASFQETDTVSAQDGLNLQKKTNGAVNIVGEVANAEQASHIIQTANVASLFAMFTHHAKTTKSLVNMIALNLLQMGLYKEKKDAIEISAETLNIDVHLINNKGKRYIERICEVIPLTDQEYPSEKIQRVYEEEHDGEELPYTENLRKLDEREFYKRQTDRELFRVNEICAWNKDHFELVNMPSEGMIKEIRNRLLDPNDEAEFLKDMDFIINLNNEIKEKHNTEIA